MNRYWKSLMGWVAAMNLQTAPGAVSFDDFNCRTGIVYKTVGGEALDLALFLPKKPVSGSMPIMLYTHGGGWANGDKTKIFGQPFLETLRILNDRGVACATIEYRLVRKGISTAYDCVVDCKDAARYLVKHAAELGLDPNRMGAWGGSAGGHLCLMAALAPDDQFPGAAELRGVVPTFRCVASYYPATTFVVPEVMAGSNFERPSRFTDFLGGPYDERRDLAKKLSPAEYLGPDSPSILMLHGDLDPVLSYRNATYLAEVGRQRGAHVEVLTVKNGKHSFTGNDIEPSMSEINRMSADFILRHLGRSAD